MARSAEDAATLQRLDEGLGVATRLFGDDIVALGQSGSQGVGVKIFVAETLPQVSGRAVKVNDRLKSTFVEPSCMTMYSSPI